LAGWFKITPPSNSGWVAYIQDEAVNYQFRSSAWVAYTASDTVAGFIELATQAEMEAATDVVRAVVPGRAHFHPGVAKATTRFGLTGNILYDYGVASVADTGTGEATVTFDVAFSSTNAMVETSMPRRVLVSITVGTSPTSSL
jgi:hypothetical protein